MIWDRHPGTAPEQLRNSPGTAPDRALIHAMWVAMPCDVRADLCDSVQYCMDSRAMVWRADAGGRPRAARGETRQGKEAQGIGFAASPGPLAERGSRLDCVSVAGVCSPSAGPAPWRVKDTIWTRDCRIGLQRDEERPQGPTALVGVFPSGIWGEIAG